MGRHAQTMLEIVESALRQTDIKVSVAPRSYEEIFDANEILAELQAVHASRFGAPDGKAVQAVDVLGRRIVLALMFDIAEEFGHGQPLAPVD
jgi:hypothetical protein